MCYIAMYTVYANKKINDVNRADNLSNTSQMETD